MGIMEAYHIQFISPVLKLEAHSIYLALAFLILRDQLFL